TFMITQNITAAISALIVAGACGVAAGTPLAILAGIGRCAKEGIIVKGGMLLEQLARTDAVVFDKTGTLTLGKPKVKKVLCLNGTTEKELLQILATSEQYAEHPIAQAILEKAGEENIFPGTYERLNYLAGKGLIVSMGNQDYYIGNSVLMQEIKVPVLQADIQENNNKSMIDVSDGKKILGGVFIEDTIRKEAKSAISTLRNYLQGTISLLSGDAQSIVTAMGEFLILDEAIGEM